MNLFIRELQQNLFTNGPLHSLFIMNSMLRLDQPCLDLQVFMQRLVWLVRFIFIVFVFEPLNLIGEDSLMIAKLKNEKNPPKLQVWEKLGSGVITRLWNPRRIAFGTAPGSFVFKPGVTWKWTGCLTSAGLLFSSHTLICLQLFLRRVYMCRNQSCWCETWALWVHV